jgi:formate/nitrite transporter FocA (FNT family)
VLSDDARPRVQRQAFAVWWKSIAAGILLTLGAMLVLRIAGRY